MGGAAPVGLVSGCCADAIGGVTIAAAPTAAPVAALFKNSRRSTTVFLGFVIKQGPRSLFWVPVEQTNFDARSFQALHEYREVGATVVIGNNHLGVESLNCVSSLVGRHG